jgi:hypothetical protein
MKNDCIVCQNPILKGEDRAREETVFRLRERTFRRTLSGRVAHIVCLEGKRYDADQLTLDDYIGKEERT